jgi:hypothetical protein
MAKCSNCDYPYVPKYIKNCPNCGDRGYSTSSGGDGSAAPAWLLLLISLICWGIYSIYDYCVFNENDFIKIKYKLNNAEIKVWESGDKYFYSRDYPYDSEMNSYEDSGEFKVLNDSIILFPDSIFYRGKVKPEKYYKNDFKEDIEMND